MLVYINEGAAWSLLQSPHVVFYDFPRHLTIDLLRFGSFDPLARIKIRCPAGLKTIYDIFRELSSDSIVYEQYFKDHGHSFDDPIDLFLVPCKHPTLLTNFMHCSSLNPTRFSLTF